MENEKATEDAAEAMKQRWEAPELTVHGGFEELTRFTGGAGPDDGFFDPGAAISQT